MLFNCNPGCPGKRGTTSGLVDLDQDEVVCEYCGDTLNVSSFLKKTMKQNGQVLRKAKKPFQYECETCDKSVETEVKGSKLVGKGCDKDCKFNVSNYTIYAMKKLQEKQEEGE
jgi:hypothetical protein